MASEATTLSIVLRLRELRAQSSKRGGGASSQTAQRLVAGLPAQELKRHGLEARATSNGSATAVRRGGAPRGGGCLGVLRGGGGGSGRERGRNDVLRAGRGIHSARRGTVRG